MATRFAVLLLAAVAVQAATDVTKPARLLWTIDRPDKNTAELALAAASPKQFSGDGFFIVGRSDAKRDWPWVHPGPQDEWAGARAHTFTILFGVKSLAAGQCGLHVKLAAAQPQSPSWLVITVNGQEFFKKHIGREVGEEPGSGAPGKSGAIEFDVPFPAALLKAGANEITLKTVEGSWILYDSIALEAPKGIESAPVADTVITSITSPSALIERGGQTLQPVEVCFHHSGTPTEAVISLNGIVATNLALPSGSLTCEMLVPAVEKKTPLAVAVEAEGQRLATQNVTLEPVRRMTVYLLPHSHTDIGFTQLQTAIEKKQVNNIVQAIQHARRTASYPAGARFVWNVEVLWAADLYLSRLSDAQRADFFEAVKRGQVALNGMYLNELTGLCRPEELIQLFGYSTRLAEQCGVTVDAAMISDVPGYTWGTVSAMAQAGIKYFSVAPNYFDRIGDIRVQWENKPFYWLSPSGKEKVLVWVPYHVYGLANRTVHLTPQFVRQYQAELDRIGYPYDIGYLRWCGHGDNAVPDPTICDFVKEWNTRYTWPKFIISSTSEAFRALEQRYGSKLPQVRGDWTPYWEDGAGSSARETALNRASSDALVQAQTLWAMFNPSSYPAKEFEGAWNNVLLYSEHTWGSGGSIKTPEAKPTIEQWAIKQSYALDASKQSVGSLRPRALELAGPSASGAAVDVWNTTSWPRTDLVYLTNAAGGRVVDERGDLLASQRTGDSLAVLVKDVPPLAARRLTVSKGEAFCPTQVTVGECVMDNGLLRLRVDEKTGGIIELRAQGLDANLVDTSSGEALNDYLYLIGNDLADLQHNGPVKITVGEKGPLIASLVIEADAPGCHKLSREVRLAAGCDYVEIINTVDKKRLEAVSYKAKQGKESVNFAFPFHVPAGRVLLDIPFGAIRPELDQMPGACKNWLTVGRWADVSNGDFGVTWITLDAPLIELGGITATLLNSQTDPAVWRHKIEPTQKLYSWAMNNHWGTNYRAYQEGPVRFRYILRPHRQFSPAEASRLAIGFSQPLLVRPATAMPPQTLSRLRLSSPEVLVSGFKPSDDGQALILRLFGASGKDEDVQLAWAKPEPKEVWLSDTSEKPLRPVQGAIHVPAWGVVTLRAR